MPHRSGAGKQEGGNFMNERILVADDEPDIADLVCFIFKRKFPDNPLLLRAGSLEQIQKEKPDLAILDIMMPGTSGLFVCRKSGKLTPIPSSSSQLRGKKSTDQRPGHGRRRLYHQTLPPSGMVARVKAQLRRYKKYNAPREEEDILTRGAPDHQCTDS